VPRSSAIIENFSSMRRMGLLRVWPIEYWAWP